MSNERVRLFVALELPVRVRDALRVWAGDREVDGLRLLDTDQLHVTLCFLGWQAADAAGDVARACEGLASADPPALSFGDAIWLPPRRPRVLAARLEDEGGRLTALQYELSERLQSGGWYEPERRAYMPHVTVARVGKHASVKATPVPGPPSLLFTGERVTLFRSRLTPRGARYEPLASVELV